MQSEADWLASVSVALERRRQERDGLQLLLDNEVEALQDLIEKKDAVGVVDSKVKEIAIHCQNHCKQSIEALVTRCLEAVFPENKYRFCLIYETKRDQTECRCVLTDADGNEYDPLRANGGGVVDIISFALRLANIALRVPQPAKILVLDEPFRFVSESHRDRLADLLQSLATELGFQIIMVTHIRELARGNVIEL